MVEGVLRCSDRVSAHVCRHLVEDGEVVRQAARVGDGMVESDFGVWVVMMELQARQPRSYSLSKRCRWALPWSTYGTLPS